jgi:hypothetical protein
MSFRRPQILFRATVPMLRSRFVQPSSAIPTSRPRFGLPAPNTVPKTCLFRPGESSEPVRSVPRCVGLNWSPGSVRTETPQLNEPKPPTRRYALTCRDVRTPHR